MNSKMVEAMWLSITQIEAQDMLNKMFIADWPNLKKNDRAKKHKDIFQKAYPSHMRKKNSISASDLQKLLGR